MISKFFKLKKNKWLFALALIIFAVLVVDFICIIFNVVQFVVACNNPAKLGTIFVPFNIAVILLNVLCVLLIIVFLLLKRYSKINM